MESDGTRSAIARSINARPLPFSQRDTVKSVLSCVGENVISDSGSINLQDFSLMDCTPMGTPLSERGAHSSLTGGNSQNLVPLGVNCSQTLDVSGFSQMLGVSPMAGGCSAMQGLSQPLQLNAHMHAPPTQSQL